MSVETGLFLSAVAAVLPTLIYAWVIYWADSYEKEPWWLLVAAFLWGAIPAVGLALLLNSLLSAPLYAALGSPVAAALTGTLIAPLVEESVKSVALLGILYLWRTEIDSPLDGIIYGAMVGMGFAMVENLYYFSTILAEQGAEAWSISIFLRAVVFGLNHAMFTSITGLGIAVGRLSTRKAVKVAAPIMGWATAVFLHFLHNLTVLFAGGFWFLAVFFDWGGIFVAVGIVIWAVLQERGWIRVYLADEVKLGTLTAEQYSSSYSKRTIIRHRLRGLRYAGWTGYQASGDFYRRCSELAYKKHHFTLFDDGESAELIRELRAEIRAQSSMLAAIGA